MNLLVLLMAASQKFIMAASQKFISIIANYAR